MVFVDHLGQRAVFYSSEYTIISSNFNIIVDVMKENKYKRIIEEKAVKYMLSFGYMIDDSTYIKNVKRLLPASIIRVRENQMQFDIYHIFDNTVETKDNDEEIINRIDKLFTNALSMALDKDREYNKKSLIDISGGLDCRVINYVAKKLGYKDIVNVCFSQENSNEYKVAKMLNKDLGFDMIFLPLDNANYLYKIDDIVSKNYGLSLYSTTTGVINLCNYLNFDYFGIEHGGLLGDMHDGCMPGEKYTKHEPASFKHGMRFSRVLKNDIVDDDYLKTFKNNELFTVFGRGLLAGYSTVIIRNTRFEFFSPYGDVDFYDYFLSIPIEKRVKEKILQKWIDKKYPEAFKIPYDKTMCRININKKLLKIKKFTIKVKTKIKMFLHIVEKNNMNPIEYWYRSNTHVKNFINEYYEKNIELIDDGSDLKEMIRKVFEEGNVRDKTMALTALSAIKLYLK